MNDRCKTLRCPMGAAVYLLDRLIPRDRCTTCLPLTYWQAYWPLIPIFLLFAVCPAKPPQSHSNVCELCCPCPPSPIKQKHTDTHLCT